MTAYPHKGIYGTNTGGDRKAFSDSTERLYNLADG
jgi:hypothetical protein